MKADYNRMEIAHVAIRNVSLGIDNKLDTLAAGLSKIVWQGTDREAYDAALRDWKEAITDLNAILNQIGQMVNISRENYMSAEANNVSLWQR